MQHRCKDLYIRTGRRKRPDAENRRNGWTRSPARLPFSTQEDSFPGNEDVVEKDVSALMHPERRVTDVFVVHGFELCVDAGGVVNMNDALGITGDGKGHCIGFVVGPQRRSRNDKPFMGNRGSGLLEFCVVEAAVLPPLDTLT